MIPVVYKIEFPDGDFYIGSTCNFSARRTTHLAAKRKGVGVNKKLQAAFRAHPVCAIYQIASGFSRATLHELEQQVMDIEKPALNIAKATAIPPATKTIFTAIGVSYALQYQRIKNGWPINVARNTLPGVKTKYNKDVEVRKKVIVAAGKSQTLDQWASETGLTKATLQGRLNLKWTPRQAVGMEPPPVSEKQRKAIERSQAADARRAMKTYEYNGFTGTLTTLLRHLGCESRYATVHSRVKNGWSIYEAVDTPKHHPPKYKKPVDCELTPATDYDALIASLDAYA